MSETIIMNANYNSKKIFNNKNDYKHLTIIK